MGVIELLLLSVGLAMDAFAVSICKGISMKKMNWKKAIIIGLYFGGFQALMPTLGFSKFNNKYRPLDCFCIACNYWWGNDKRVF